MADPNPNELAKKKLEESGIEILQCAWASQLAYLVEKEERIKHANPKKKAVPLVNFFPKEKEEITDEDKKKKADILRKLEITEDKIHPVYSPPCCGVVIDMRPNKTIAAFTGTDELKDWGINLNAMPAIGPDGKLTHGGIWETLQKDGVTITSTGEKSINITDQIFAERMRDEIAKYSNGKKIIYTGDSLGGGLAKLAAADHIGHNKDKELQIELNTFSGAPVGPFIANYLSKKLREDHVFSVARKGDIVSVLGGATNAGVNMTIHPDNSLSAEFRPTDGALERFFKNTGVLLFSGINPLDAHRIDGVVEDLERIIPNPKKVFREPSHPLERVAEVFHLKPKQTPKTPSVEDALKR